MWGGWRTGFGGVRVAVWDHRPHAVGCCLIGSRGEEPEATGEEGEENPKAETYREIHRLSYTVEVRGGDEGWATGGF